VTLDELPATLALEVDALCDDFERHWRRARRVGTPPPGREPFLSRATVTVRDVLERCLDELERDLRAGVALPQVPGLLVEEEIGRGGMGVVYRARRLADGHLVALKLIPGAEHARWSRWQAELADLRHPNLVPVEASGTHEGLHFIAMPFVPGGDLRERLAEFTTPRAVASLLARVADAVAFLHRQGILHRDLKPSNILLAAQDSHEPLVCDFGLAGRLEDTQEPGRVGGTPRYMAPEQREGRPLTAAADVWSLGAVLSELLTRNAITDATLDDIRRHCLEPQATDRPTAADLAYNLSRHLTRTTGHDS
jgi:serine/threonine protein kinase